MRNGNKRRVKGVKDNKEVLILPMRNGNTIVLDIFTTKHKFLSYLWGMETCKNGKMLFFIYSSSYPTYEEWKLPSLPLHILVFPSSYPTYEEWKLKLLVVSFWNYRVLILPMRNGNEIEQIKKVLSNSFLSYLWGMETLHKQRKGD